MKKTLCSGCGLYFSKTKEFDAHRVGQFGVDRRCLTSDELVSRGFTAVEHVITDEIGRPTRLVWSREKTAVEKKRLLQLQTR